MRRLIYSPEVKVYIQPSGVDKNGKSLSPIDISEDIIEGSIERRANDISTARFVLQGRKLGKRSEDDSGSLLLSKIIRPMDRIVVYLKKTKPILVFSGYLDLVPLVQFVPEPVVIEASCTLKRLQYTYWDPTLPTVYKAFIEMGLVPQPSESGLSVWQVPQSDSSGLGKIEDQGFSKLLQFLIVQVGGWNPDSVFIEPLPKEWIELAEPMWRKITSDNENTWKAAKAFLEPLLGATTSDNTDSVITGETSPLVDEAKVKKFLEDNDADPWMIANIPTFMKIGNKYGLDPRFQIAIVCHEIGFGKYGPAKKNYNPGGLGGTSTSMSFKNWEEGLSYQAGPKCLTGNLYKGLDTIEAIAPKYCKNGAGDTWENPVKSFFQKMGGNPNAAVKGPDYKRLLEQAADKTRNSAAGTGARNPNSLTVYIDAFGAGTSENDRLYGYQKKDVFGRTYDNESTTNRINKNLEIAERIRDRVKEHLKNLTAATINGAKLGPAFPDNIDFVVATRSANILSQNWEGDLYIAVDHSDSRRTNNVCYYSVPTGSTPDLTRPDAGFDSSFGTGWQKPSSVGGRDSIKKDKGLINNSNKFINCLKKASENPNSNKNGGKFTLSKNSENSPTSSKNAWNGSVPGFFYAEAAACAYLQLPNKSDDKWIPQTDDWSWQIAIAIFDYYRNVKLNSKNGQQETQTSGVPSSNAQTGDNSLASKLIRLCNKAAIAKQNGANLTYTLGGVRNKNLSDCIRDEDTMDCSGFIYNGFKEIGIKESGNTVTLWNSSKKISDKTKYKAGHFFIKGGPTGNGGAGHVVLVTNKDGSCVHCASTPDGPVFTTASNYVNDSSYELCEHKLLGTTEKPPVGQEGFGSDSGDGSQEYQDALRFGRAAFNVAYNFPGTMVESLLFRGHRALQNDVPLIDSVRDITIGSMRNFSSLPNGDFIAWYPDYFNIARKNPWLRISAVELKKCTIDLSDKSLATHVYIMGNPYGVGSMPSANAEWYQRLQGAGVVTIEQEGLVDSFLMNLNTSNENRDQLNDPTERDTRPALDFLEKYGARPYTEENLTLRHPVIEVFYAYHTFIQKWAEQFISRAEFTFMPELFPGMIVEIPNYKDETMNFSFYVQEVNHTFSYDNGFSTNAILIAPGWAYYPKTKDKDTRPNLGLIPVRPPSDVEREPISYKIRPVNVNQQKQSYKDWLKGRKSTKQLAAEWKKLQGINK